LDNLGTIQELATRSSLLRSAALEISHQLDRKLLSRALERFPNNPRLRALRGLSGQATSSPSDSRTFRVWIKRPAEVRVETYTSEGTLIEVRVLNQAEDLYYNAVTAETYRQALDRLPPSVSPLRTSRDEAPADDFADRPLATMMHPLIAELLEPKSLVDSGISVTNVRDVVELGRSAVQARATLSDWDRRNPLGHENLPPADAYVLTIDIEYGILLSMSALIDDTAFSARAVTFFDANPEIAPALFDSTTSST
jgi:hypothetical protein